MGERQVSVGGNTMCLEKLFLVMATQNPIEQEGTYPLPEAQLDRFLMHVVIGYPNAESEQKILRLVRGEAMDKTPEKVESIRQEDIFAARPRNTELTLERFRRKIHRAIGDGDSRTATLW